jgi:hypothetical protein
MKAFHTSSLLIIAIFFTACNATKMAQKNQVSDFEMLKSMMVGTFNSSAHAARDTNYYDITLHMYPIWEDDAQTWLYVEQTVTSMPDKPYRQRVYRLEQADKSTFKSYIYTFEDPKLFVGAWKNKSIFDSMKPSEVILKEGCEVVLKKQKDGSFSGKTGAQTCKSSLRGASFATSEVTVVPGKIVSWDQGWDDKGEQVWGATLAGYEFVKVK